MKLYDNALGSNYEEIKNFYPVWYREVFEMDAIWRATGGKLDELQNGINRAVDNCFISTADAHAIGELEKFLYIDYDATRSLPDRRALVASFFIGNGHVGEKEIKEIVSTFTPGEIEVALIGGTTEISVTREISDRFNLADCSFIILKRIPAHLKVVFNDILRPIRFINNFELLLDTFGVQIRFFNGGETEPTLLDGTAMLNGEMLLNQAFRGIGLKEFSAHFVFNAVSRALALAMTLSPMHLTNYTALSLEAFRASTVAYNSIMFSGVAMKTFTRVQQSYSIAGSVTIDSMYELDGSQTLNGTRKLNANIIKEVI